jgi:protein required for attachment to host cells
MPEPDPLDTPLRRQARALMDRTGRHPVISLYLDLDPDRFATAPARSAQITSLLDRAKDLGEALALDHDARATLAADHDRVSALLHSDELPVSGAAALAVFCSGSDDLLETVALPTAMEGAVFVAPTVHVEPLVTAPALGRWCAALVSTDQLELVEGEGHRQTARTDSRDYVRGDTQVGDAQTHAREQDIEGHLQQVADELHRRWQRHEFTLLALAGPVAPLSQLRTRLHPDVEKAVAGELSLDPSAARDADIVAAVVALAAQRTAQAQEAALEQLRSRAAGDERVALGEQAVDAALVERRVQTLLLGRDLDDHDTRREAAVQTALAQDAGVLAYTEPVEELPATRPIAALLRF